MKMPPDRMQRERERDRKSLSPRQSEGVRLYTNKLPRRDTKGRGLKVSDCSWTCM